jgi:hypothetical protein
LPTVPCSRSGRSPTTPGTPPTSRCAPLVFEWTRARSVEHGEPCRVTTDRGIIRHAARQGRHVLRQGISLRPPLWWRPGSTRPGHLAGCSSARQRSATLSAPPAATARPT